MSYINPKDLIICENYISPTKCHLIHILDSLFNFIFFSKKKSELSTVNNNIVRMYADILIQGH